MKPTTWTITLSISRQSGSAPRHFQEFTLEVNPDEYVLDAVERVWAFHDRSLNYRHACHHSTCGACGMVVNGVEKLTCITPIREVTRDRGTLRIEPLRNFPVQSDLVVDMSAFYQNMEASKLNSVSPVEKADLPIDLPTPAAPAVDAERLVDCIECGLCVSVCPAAATSDSYVGPAALAGAHQQFQATGEIHLLDWADHQDGLWRCHSAYECTAVCPSNVNPAWRIMNLRRHVVTQRIRSLFGAKEPRP